MIENGEQKMESESGEKKHASLNPHDKAAAAHHNQLDTGIGIQVPTCMGSWLLPYLY